MELTFQCPSCHAINHIGKLEMAEDACCTRCGSARPLHGETIKEGKLLSCPWCSTADLYIQKDFPQGLGLFIVVVGFAISTFFWYFERPVLTYLVLLLSALVDMMLYYRVPDVTICYRCLSQVRGAGSNTRSRLHPFDLAIGERYRQERIRIEELRKRGDTVESSPASWPRSNSPVENA